MYQVIWTYDGCPDAEASRVYATQDECKAFIQGVMQKHAAKFKNDPKLGLDILNIHTGRFMSYVL